MSKVTHENADKRFIKCKAVESKQKSDSSAAAKVKRLQKQATAMEEEEQLMEAHRVPPLVLESADFQHTDRPIVHLVDVNFQYEGSRDVILHEINCQIGGTDKILVQAGNGQGKSTLIRIMMGQLKPNSGEVRERHVGVVAYFPQDALFELVSKFGNGSSVELLQKKDNHLSLTNARSYLGRFGLKGNLALRPVKTLSAGQRVRLWLAREFMTEEKPSLLILDETTENLDKETTDSLVESIKGFSGAVLAISHDEYFAESFPATQIWRIQNGYLRSDYLEFS